jgi:hypothetical protein
MASPRAVSDLHRAALLEYRFLRKRVLANLNVEQAALAVLDCGLSACPPVYIRAAVEQALSLPWPAFEPA